METKQIIHRVLEFEDRLRQYAYSLTTNQEDANDLLQDTYLKVMQYADRFSEDTNLKAWVFTIMRNTFINGYRRKCRSKVFTDESEDGYCLNQVPNNPCDATDMHLYVNEISKAISTMKEPQRVAFEMFMDGFKYYEIADILNLSIGTVKSRIHFARQKLMNTLSDYSPDLLPLSA